MIAPPAPAATNPDGDSDSDWDDDDDFSSKKINIKIKPIGQVTPSRISASVDELRATVGTWKSLANINLVKPNSRRHHQSTLHLNNTEGNKRPVSMLVPATVPPVDLSKESSGEDELNQFVGRINNNKDYRDRYSMMVNNISSQPIQPDFENLGVSINNQFNQTDILSNGHCLKPSSSAVLDTGIDLSNIETSFNRDESRIKFPVAIAIQECLNAKFLGDETDSSYLIGQVKLAVPPKILDLQPSDLEQKLEVTLISSIPFDKIDLRDEFVTHSDSIERLSIDMKAVQAFVKKQSLIQQNSKYYILPELLKYGIRSQDKTELTGIVDSNVCLNPLKVVAHWLCDLDKTNVRIDIQFLENALEEFRITTDDIRNLKIFMHLDGGVVSYQSKPEANWNPLESKLTWSFSSLKQLIEKSTVNNVTSCLARFNLNDGPSAPSDVSLKFSVAGKTFSGSRFILSSTNNYQIIKQKFEVRTGIFRCQAPCN